VPGWLAGGGELGGLRVSGTKRNKPVKKTMRGKEHGRKVLEQEGRRVCTQHDQVFIANFMDLVKKAYNPLPSPLSQKERTVRTKMLYSVGRNIHWLRFFFVIYFIRHRFVCRAEAKTNRKTNFPFLSIAHNEKLQT
jgi:hypothetical protein